MAGVRARTADHNPAIEMVVVVVVLAAAVVGSAKRDPPAGDQPQANAKLEEGVPPASAVRMG